MSNNKVELNKDFFENIPKSNDFYNLDKSILCKKETQEYNSCFDTKGFSPVCAIIKQNLDLCIKKYKK
jgi:hypothetical protein